jgi:hypothetical protein
MQSWNNFKLDTGPYESIFKKDLVRLYVKYETKIHMILHRLLIISVLDSKLVLFGVLHNGHI